jgi:hypothetical protein
MPNFLDLATELQLLIIEQIDTTHGSSLHDFSSTCKALRHLAAPTLFRDLVLQNDETSGKIVQSIASGPYASYVCHLHFRGIIQMPTPEDWGDEAGSPNDEDLPASVQRMLMDLTIFPKLESLSVEFPWTDGEFTDGFYNFEEEESYEEVLQVEENEGWRNFMAKTYKAVGAQINSGHATLRSLELRNLAAKEVSSWKDEAFRNLLEGLESFSVSIREGDNGAGWRLGTLMGYVTFLSKMDVFFSDHLTHTTHFSYMASTSGMPGLIEGSLPFKPTQMPKLRVLELKATWLAPDLLPFLETHAETLESMRFEDCFSGADSASTSGTWSELFTTLSRLQPNNLKSVEVLPLREFIKYKGCSNDIERAVKEQRAVKGRKAFPYGYEDEGRGRACEDDDMDLEAFLKGEDQRAWDGLVDILEKNRGRSIARSK